VTVAVLASIVAQAQTPLTELTGGSYQGFEGGLYPGGTNSPPASLAAAAASEADRIQPLDANGAPDDGGRVGLISASMSNGSQEFKDFERRFDTGAHHQQMVLVNAAQGGVAAERMADPDDVWWTQLDERLAAAGLTPAQVQVCWLKQALGNVSTLAFPDHADALRGYLRDIVRRLRARFPNLRLCYLSSRIYGGYTDRADRGEPLSFESAFAVKWLIGDQLDGDPELNWDPAAGPVRAPLLLWGPYLWANGTDPRQSDGLVWKPGDFADDGFHPGPAAERKVGGLLNEFFDSAPSAGPWMAGRLDRVRLFIPASADAAVDESAPGTNFGAAPWLAASGGAPTRLSLLRFELGAIREPVAFAHLTGYTGRLGGAEWRTVDGAWDESTVTWLDRPPVPDQPMISSPGWSGDASFRLEFTTPVQNAAGNAMDIAFTESGSSERVLVSREGAAAPALVVTLLADQVIFSDGMESP